MKEEISTVIIGDSLVLAYFSNGFFPDLLYFSPVISINVNFAVFYSVEIRCLTYCPGNFCEHVL